MLYASRPGAIRAAVLYAAFVSSTGAFVPHNLTGQNFSSFSGTYGMMLFDPAWGALGRVLLFPAALQITQACPAPGPCKCSVAYEPDASMWYFDVAPSLTPSENIALTEMHTSNVGPELLTPDATVYIPARGCRPPLILSYGGSFVNVCASPEIKQLYSDPDNGNASWCFSPSYAVHMLRLDTLSWVHIDAPGGPPANISNNTELAGYHLGVGVVYDRELDAVILAGGFYRTNRNVADIPRFMATYALDLGSLCNAGSEIIVGALKPSRYMQQSRQWARVLSFDALAWLQVLPQGPEIDIAAYESMALGLFASDSVNGRVVQFDGIDMYKCSSTGKCYSYAFGSESWEQQPNCTFVDTSGPFNTWDAATTLIPGGREALHLGGRQTLQWVGKFACQTLFASSNDHWLLHFDELRWERLSTNEAYWGLPQLSGARVVAAPLPDGTDVIFVWGGVRPTPAAPPVLVSDEYSCGIFVKSELAYPFFFEPGPITEVYVAQVPSSQPRTSLTPAVAPLPHLLLLTFLVAAVISSCISVSAFGSFVIWRLRMSDLMSFAHVGTSVGSEQSSRGTGAAASSSTLTRVEGAETVAPTVSDEAFSTFDSVADPRLLEIHSVSVDAVVATRVMNVPLALAASGTSSDCAQVRGPRPYNAAISSLAAAVAHALAAAFTGMLAHSWRTLNAPSEHQTTSNIVIACFSFGTLCSATRSALVLLQRKTPRHPSHVLGVTILASVPATVAGLLMLASVAGSPEASASLRSLPQALPCVVGSGVVSAIVLLSEELAARALYRTASWSGSLASRLQQEFLQHVLSSGQPINLRTSQLAMSLLGSVGESPVTDEAQAVRAEAVRRIPLEVE